jgi:hypothetical protein
MRVVSGYVDFVVEVLVDEKLWRLVTERMLSREK